MFFTRAARVFGRRPLAARLPGLAQRSKALDGFFRIGRRAKGREAHVTLAGRAKACARRADQGRTVEHMKLITREGMEPK